MTRTLLFLPGFMTAPAAYEELLAPVTESGWEVVVPQLHRPGVRALMGRPGVREEAGAAAQLVAGHCVIGGHSRGGQVAWLAAGAARVAGVLLIDPVDGHSRRPRGPESTARPAGFECPCLVIGAGVEGRCAPKNVNYEHFTAATPSAEQIVVPDLGHADVLCGRAQAWGRLLCGGSARPDVARATVSELMLDFLARV